MLECSTQIFNDTPYIRRISALSDNQLHGIDAYLQNLLRQDSALLRKTHYFHDRFENIYLDTNSGRSGNDDLDQLIDESLGHCAGLLQVEQQALKIGYWFNLMEPGQLTTLHRHDDYDELVSGVVYLKVPANSGDLVLQVNDGQLCLPPVSGNFIYFSPRTPHRVSENHSGSRRLSIGMNIGPAKK